MSAMLLTNTMITGPVLYGDNNSSGLKLNFTKNSPSTSSTKTVSKQHSGSNVNKIEIAEFAKQGKTTLNTSFMPKATQEEVMSYLKGLESKPEMQANAIVNTLLSSGSGLGTYETGMNAAVYALNGKNLQLVDKIMQEKAGVSLKDYLNSELSSSESKDLFRHINQYQK